MISKPARYKGTAIVILAILTTVLMAINLPPRRFYAEMLVVSLFFTSIPSLAALFTAVLFLSGATWWQKFSYIPLSLTRFLPVSLLIWVLIWFGRKELYSWADPQWDITSHPFRQAYLNQTFVLVRNLVGAGLMIGLAHRLNVLIPKAIKHHSPGMANKTRRVAALYVIVFMGFITLVTWDWLLTLNDNYHSAAFSWYVLASLFSAGVACMSLLLLVNRQRLIAGDEGNRVRYTLSKYVFAFSLIWLYFWFSQIFLSWYGNLPHESAYFVSRISLYSAGFYLVLTGCFALPFLLLFSENQKKQPLNLFAAASASFMGQWLNIYLLVIPELYPSGVRFIGLSFVLFSLFTMFVLYSHGTKRKNPKLSTG